MERNLLKELQDLLNLVETFKRELAEVSSKKEGIKTISEHINLSITESEEAVKRIIELIGKSLGDLEELKSLIGGLDEGRQRVAEEKLNSLSSQLTNALTLLEFQDILAQRLLKIKDFLNDLEKSLVRVLIISGLEENKISDEEVKKKLEELEWKKEISQEDVDEIMKQFGL